MRAVTERKQIIVRAARERCDIERRGDRHQGYRTNSRDDARPK
jgi:hypothetical protein